MATRWKRPCAVQSLGQCVDLRHSGGPSLEQLRSSGGERLVSWGRRWGDWRKRPRGYAPFALAWDEDVHFPRRTHRVVGTSNCGECERRQRALCIGLEHAQAATVIEIKAALFRIDLGCLDWGEAMAHLLRMLEARVDTGFALYRRMCGHLGVPRTDDVAPDCAADIHTALMACASCKYTGLCCRWLDQDQPGIPSFCRAYSAFARLSSN